MKDDERHMEARACAGALAYAPWEADRREIGPKELASADDGPSGTT